MPAVQPVQPVPGVKPVARRAATWLGAPTSKPSAAMAFDDVLAACLERPASAACRPASAPRAAEAMPPLLVDRAERRLSASAGREERRQRRPFSAIAAAYRAQTTPACPRPLGLQLPCPEAGVRQAYRQRARALHPDTGGDPHAFKALRASYEEALRLASASAA